MSVSKGFEKLANTGDTSPFNAMGCTSCMRPRDFDVDAGIADAAPMKAVVASDCAKLIVSHDVLPFLARDNPELPS